MRNAALTLREKTMAFDAIVTRAMVKELNDTILLGKIEKVYQPEKEELVLNIHTKKGNVKLFASASSSNPRIHFIETAPQNPPVPLSFCMLMRKNLQGGRIVKIEQKGCERIIEIYLETLNELGFTVSKKLVFEIMGKHSNIILVDTVEGKIIDSIKRVSIDTSRVRQVLPGKLYEYPPAQDKIDYDKITEEELDGLEQNKKTILARVGGISPNFAQELAARSARYKYLHNILDSIEQGTFQPCLYVSDEGQFMEYYIMPLSAYEEVCNREDFDTLSECMSKFFDNKDSSNRARQRSHQLTKNVGTMLNKLYLKKQRLSEDILKAENSDNLRLYGELLTANIHLAKTGASSVKVTNYYDGSEVEIPLDSRFSASKNAQIYFKRYGKSKTAIKEKQVQLAETSADIEYLESVFTYLENSDSVEDIEAIRQELTETGYLRKRKVNYKEKKFKAKPLKYKSPSGFTVLVGRNNKENDMLTMKTASKNDIWFHTKDIPGSHVILQLSEGNEKLTGQQAVLMEDEEIAEDILFCCSIAAYYSKGRSSENVPVDYVRVRYVKKPAGAKPGMVIFTNNHTVWSTPKLPIVKEESL